TCPAPPNAAGAGIVLNPMRGPQTLSLSPWYGVTDVVLLVSGRVSETFNNGQNYKEEVSNVIKCVPSAEPGSICWKVRNSYRITKVEWALYRKGEGQEPDKPIWQETWDTPDKLTKKLLQNPLQAGEKTINGQQVPVMWSGSMDWPDEDLANRLVPTDPAKDVLYQLRMTVNGAEPGAERRGYPLVAWTYFYVSVPKGWLAVQLTYQGMPLAGLPVEFCTLTADNKQGKPVGDPQVTDDQGIARLPTLVPMGFYGCVIEHQPLAVVNPVAQETASIELALPIGEPQMDLYDDLLLEALDEDEDEADL
ncbi:MAG TPA: hypothetical protein VLQ80_03535, partial [Candidatus Saccharimonadia bacterium]|nr:hypothetical protein [Candidatus Saccharimonadia bacterium]